MRKNSLLTLLGSLGIVLVLGATATGCGELLPGPSSGGEGAAAVESTEDGAAEGAAAEGDGEGAVGDEGDTDEESDTGGQGGNGGGDSAQPGDLEFTFVSMTVDAGAFTSAGTGDEYVPDGQYVLVELELENHGSETVEYSPAPLRLVDAQGVEHEHDIPATVAKYDALESFRLLEPGDHGSQKILFDIPVDALPSYMIVGETGYGAPTANLALN
ncbi:DUF4352 domain-containing protein [Nocardiopsis valliformis]|uniref:DUF4352 domain-containing protein n=1 Tax=Nocardiopsis valliformis TaxID=239974 RepID=UPI00034D092A|nr:DUF4352 domain-containing protein [Nocardiopsis valliformis]